MARSAPAEYTIDILFRTISSSKVNDERRKELLEEAFLLAPLVQHPYRIWTTGFHADMRETMLSMAMRLRLDTLAVRSRVVRGMLKLDPERAMEMLSSFPPLQVPKLPCDATFTPDVAIYYDTLTEVAQYAFQDPELKDEVLWSLEREIQTTHSSIQLAPLGKALKNMDSLPGVFERLSPIYIARVGQISDGSRAFGYAATRRLQDIFLWLLDGYQSRSISTIPVWTAFRTYISDQLKGPRCADMVRAGPYLKDIQILIDTFNSRVPQTSTSSSDAIRPISEEEARPTEVADGPSFSKPWDFPQRKKVIRDISGLRHGEQWQDEDARLTPEWRIAALNVLRETQHIKLDFAEDEIGLFHLKVRLYSELFDLAPTKEIRETVADVLIEYLNQSTVSYKHPTEFLWLLSLPLRMARTLNDDGEQIAEKGGQFIMLPNEHGYLILEKMRRSNSVVLQLYAQVEEILPAPLTDPRL